MAKLSISYLNERLYDGEGTLDRRDIKKEIEVGAVFKANLLKPIRY
ncbi:MAG: hypothetical protein Q8Q31_02380 [Nanoarchaeota archaeon]|nr:hypothetical protein [Nanoarchaeota archaeon]